MALVGLNLSRNNLKGFIPSNIGHMERLEALDLSRNHLSDRMPTSFSNFTFLSYMNLSYNNLEFFCHLSLCIFSILTKLLSCKKFKSSCTTMEMKYVCGCFILLFIVFFFS